MEEKIFTEKPFPIPASNEDIKLLLGEIPKKPGVYRFLDEHGYPLYIGCLLYTSPSPRDH